MKKLLEDGWSLYPTEITEIQDNVWKVKTEKDTYALKKTELKEEHLHFICAAEHSLVKRGFHNFAILISTTNDHPYYATEEGFYTLHHWIEGERCDFQSEEHLFAAAKTLAKMHTLGKELSLQSYHNRRGNYFEHAEHIGQRINELRDFYRTASTSTPSAFTRAYCRDYPKLIAQAQEAKERLIHSSLPKLIADAEEVGAFIHYDVAARNFIILNKKAFLIDFDYCRCDLPLTDLARLLKRALKQGSSYQNRMAAILNGYQRHKPISEEEFEVLCAFLLFPQKYWRIAHRYFTEKYQRDEAFFIKKWNIATQEAREEELWLPLLTENRRLLF